MKCGVLKQSLQEMKNFKLVCDFFESDRSYKGAEKHGRGNAAR